MFKLALLLMLVGSSCIMTVVADPLVGIGLVLVSAGVTLLREYKRQ